MARHLIVREAFGDYAKGDRISDAKDVAAVLASDQASHVIPINVEDPPSAKAPTSSASD